MNPNPVTNGRSLNPSRAHIAHRLKIEIFGAITAIAASGVAVLMSEQDALNTLRVAQRVYVLENGHVARSGSSSELAGDDHIRHIYLGV